MSIQKIVVTILLTVLIVGTICYAKSKKEGLTTKEAQRFLTKVAGINLKSSDIKVESVSTLGSSAVVVAQIKTAFRLVKQLDGSWKPVEVRTGERRWQDLEELARALNDEKSSRTRTELELLSNALESFKRDHGFYVTGDNQMVLMDHLTPNYISRVIHIDPWSQPYLYKGDKANYEIRSIGADGKPNTSDDIVVEKR
jgi:hypothetical protein